jgi:hypothetical protein
MLQILGFTTADFTSNWYIHQVVVSDIEVCRAAESAALSAYWIVL